MIKTPFLKMFALNLRRRLGPLAWVWLVFLTAFLIAGSTFWYTVRQRQIASQINQELALLHQSQADLTRGYLHIMGSPSVPFDRNQGLALFSKAQAELEQALQLHQLNLDDEVTTRSDGQPTLAGLIQEVTTFRTMLAAQTSSDQAGLTAGFYDLVQHAGEVDNRIQQNLTSLNERYTQVYMGIQIGVGILLAVLCAAVFIDSQARQQAEQAVRELEGRFRKMLEGVQLVAVIIDSEGRVDFCNDYLLTLTGWQRQQVLGQDWFERFMPSDSTQVKEVFKTSISSGSIVENVEGPILTRQGEQRQMLFNNIMLRDGTGRISGIASLGADITERRLGEIRLKEQNDELRRWHAITLGREERIIELKDEVNKLLIQAGLPPQYTGAVAIQEISSQVTNQQVEKSGSAWNDLI
jgi:PAS domain S-box-containing protein